MPNTATIQKRLAFTNCSDICWSQMTSQRARVMYLQPAPVCWPIITWTTCLYLSMFRSLISRFIVSDISLVHLPASSPE